MRLRTHTLALLLISFTGSAMAGNWPHWRGEGGNGVASDATPPTEWSETKNIKWKVAIPGRGSSSPVVWEDKVLITAAVPKGGQQPTAQQPYDFVLYCVDRSTGNIKWQRTAATATPPEGTHVTNSYASASPTTDGQHVYAHFGSQGLYCFTMEGQPVWDRDFGDMRTRNEFGEGSSPTIAGDMIIVPWDHEGPSYLYALNKLTGDVVWETKRDEPTNWSTPLIVEHGGQQQIIMNGQTAARAYDLKTGKELWRCGGQTQRPAASAVGSGDMVFVASGFRGSFIGAFKLGGEGNIEGTDNVVWTMNRNTPDIATPLLSNGRLYYFKEKTGILTCVDARTGKVNYTNQRTGLRTIYASPVAAGGHVYMTDRDGTTVVIKDAEKYEEVARNSVGETVDGTPAPVDDQLFLRGEEHLFCVE